MTNEMSIAEFCRERRLPQRRILRLVKRAALRHVSGAEEKDDDEVTDSDGWRADLSEEIGVVARREEGKTRITYAVVAPDLLASWCARQLGADLLTENQIDHIAEAARSYYRLVMGENEDYAMTSREYGTRFSPNKEGYFAPLDEALRQMGK